MNFYTTTSTNIAAWLIMRKFKLLETHRVQGKAVFYFEKTQAIFDSIDEYKLNCDIQDFIGAYKQVKDAMR